MQLATGSQMNLLKSNKCPCFPNHFTFTIL